MNRIYSKALLIGGLMATMAARALADDWVIDCEDPTSKTSPYSTDWGENTIQNDLFWVDIGFEGTVNYSKYCFPPSGITIPMRGRIGFSIGAVGSTQDNLAGSPLDDMMGLTFGTYTGVAGNFSIAKLRYSTTVVGGDGTAGNYFGQNDWNTFYVGASDRYLVADTTNNSVEMHLRADIIGDTCKLTWQLQNQTTSSINLGLWFGQWVAFNGIQGPHSASWVNTPGIKPLSFDAIDPVSGKLQSRYADQRFVHGANPSANPPQLEMPPYVNFGWDQSNAYGLQVVLQPSSQIPDQTPCDGIDVGTNGLLLGSMTASDGAMPDVVRPDFDEESGSNAYLQKWETQPVAAFTGNAPGGADTRTIVSYYKSTWSTVDYGAPYEAVLDAPPVIGTQAGNASNFSNSPFTLTVNIDNTLGFSTIFKEVPLQDVQVTVNLPQGMSDANNPNSQVMTTFINQIDPVTIAQAQFKIAVDPTLFGNQQYTVTIQPNPGTTKVLTGTIDVASQPFLQVSAAANLLSAPWAFTDSTWNTILGANTGMVLDQDYQVFGWDGIAQAYVLQTGPQRGFGSFVVSNVAAGFVPLGGNPSQVQDIQSGAPQVIVHPGWNLIANPYNYAIPIGQLVGVPEADNQNAYTWTELVNANVVSGFLAYWDSTIAGYHYTTSDTDLIQPNTGYWLFVQSPQDVVLNYPPVFQNFLPGLPDVGEYTLPRKNVFTPAMAVPTWSLNMVVRGTNAIDAQTYIGQTTTGAIAKALTQYKAPAAPVANTISASVMVPNGKKTMSLARALTAEGVGTQTWNWNVYTASNGVATVTWPNMSSVPSNVSIKLVDLSNGVQRNMRQSANYSFAGKAHSTHNFQVIVTTGAQLPVITSTSATAASTFKGAYTLSVNATSTVTVTQNNQVIATLVSGRNDNSGTSAVTWNYTDAANRSVKNGTYQLVVNSTPSGGATATKSVSFVVKR